MSKKFRYEPPEGGWGILICLSSAIPLTTGIASLPSFGILFGEFFKSIGAETSGISIVTSTYFLCISSSSLFAGALSKRFGVRRMALCGAFLNTLGAFLQIFVSSTLHLIVAFGLLQGTGYGFMVPTFFTIFNDYFVKKRIFWMGVLQSLIGVLTMLYPVLAHALLENYGFRGTLAILCAINAHAIYGMQVLHPVEWHMRKVAIKDHELTEVTELGKAVNDNELKQDQSTTDTSHQNSPLLNKTEKFPQPEKIGGSFKRRSSSIISLSYGGGPIFINDDSPALSRQDSVLKQPKDPQKSFWKEVVEFMDLSLLKNPIYLNIALGISCSLYADIAFFTLQSIYLFELGFSNQSTSQIVAIGAAADLVSRLFLSLLSVFLQTSSRNIYFVGAILSILSRFVFLEVTDFMSVAVITAVMGFIRTWVHVPVALVFAECLPKERFTTGYGLYVCIQGYIGFAFGLLIGYVRDKTGSYIITFHVLNALLGLCVLTWMIEFIYINYFKKKEISTASDANKATDKTFH